MAEPTLPPIPPPTPPDISPLAAELETLRGVYAALNRGDIGAMVASFDPGIEWIEPPEYPGSRSCRGRAEVEEHVRAARGRWAEWGAEGGCVPRRYIAGGDTIVVYLEIRVRMKGAEGWIVGDTTDVYTFRGGRAVRMRTFPTWGEAVEWAGVGSEIAIQSWPE